MYWFDHLEEDAPSIDELPEQHATTFSTQSSTQNPPARIVVSLEPRVISFQDPGYIDICWDANVAKPPQVRFTP
jgi:hypothetical protein